MKKTLIALLAAGSVYAADSVTADLTTGISITKDGETNIVSALNAAGNDFVGTAALNNLNVGSSFNTWSGSKNVSDITFNVTVGALYGAAGLDWDNAASVTLNSFSYIGNPNGWCEDEGRTITVTLGEQSKSILLDGTNEDGTKVRPANDKVLTFSGLDFDLTKDSVLTISLKPSSSKDTDNMSLATADIYGKNGATVAWSGVQSEKDVPNLGMTNNWSYEAPLVKLNVTVTPAVPEPATATLSLLALAGLASRRRRH